MVARPLSPPFPMPRPPRTRSGFTLIELLTVIAIIGILAGMIIGAVQVVKKKASIAASKAIFSQWCTAVEQYKTTYGVYPTINSTYETSKDTVVSLDNTTAAAEFIKCLSGRQPIFDGGNALSTEDRKKYNRQATSFCDIDPAAFQKDDSGAYTKKLADAFGNSKIRLLMDTDGNGMVKPTDISGDKNDYGIDANGYVGRKVVIYTLGSDDPSQYEDVLSWK